MQRVLRSRLQLKIRHKRHAQCTTAAMGKLDNSRRPKQSGLFSQRSRTTRSTTNPRAKRHSRFSMGSAARNTGTQQAIQSQRSKSATRNRSTHRRLLERQALPAQIEVARRAVQTLLQILMQAAAKARSQNVSSNSSQNRHALRAAQHERTRNNIIEGQPTQQKWHMRKTRSSNTCTAGRPRSKTRKHAKDCHVQSMQWKGGVDSRRSTSRRSARIHPRRNAV